MAEEVDALARAAEVEATGAEAEEGVMRTLRPRARSAATYTVAPLAPPQRHCPSQPRQTSSTDPESVFPREGTSSSSVSSSSAACERT